MIKLYHGDCLDVMPTLPEHSIDAIVADIPYGTTACKWDIIIPLDQMWSSLKRLIKPNGAIVLCATQPFTSTLIASNIDMFRYCWVWDKVKATNFMSAKLMPLLKTEDICIFSHATCNSMSKVKMVYNPQGVIEYGKEVTNGKNVGGKVAQDRRAIFIPNKTYTQEKTGYPKNIIQISNDANSYHPTQKPVALMEYLIRTYTNEDETILDFTMGSGSTGVAAKNTGRLFIGIEKDETYFNIAKSRINE